MADRKRHAQAERKLLNAYRLTFSSGEGKLVLDDLCNLFYRRTSLYPDANPNKTLIAEGKRFVVLHIMAALEAADTPDGASTFELAQLDRSSTPPGQTTVQSDADATD